MIKLTSRKIVSLWILSMIGFISFTYSDIFMTRAAPFNPSAPWVIDADVDIIYTNFPLYYNITINSYITASFYQCDFWFLNMTPGVITRIYLEFGASLILDHCNFYGNATQNGNGLIYGDYNSSLIVKNCNFNDLGYYTLTKNEAGIHFYGNYSLVEDSTFTGNFTQIDMRKWNTNGILANTTIQRCNFMNLITYPLTSCIYLGDQPNVEILNNSIVGFLLGIESYNLFENVHILNNKLINQTYSSGMLRFAEVVPESGRAIITNNTAISKDQGFDLGLPSYFTFVNNSVTSTGSGITITSAHQARDCIIANNSFIVDKGSNLNHYSAVTFNTGLQNTTISNNSLTTGSFSGFAGFLSILYLHHIYNFTFENNTMNNQNVWFFYNLRGYDTVLDFTDTPSLGEIVLFNCSQITLKNANFTSYSGSIKLYQSNDTTLANLTVINAYEPIYLEECVNVTLSNSSSLNNLTTFDILPLQIIECNKTMVDNCNISSVSKQAVNLNWCYNTTIQNSNISSSGDALMFFHSNSSLIQNNYIFGEDGCVWLDAQSYYNNFTHNDFIKWNFGDHDLMRNITIYGYENNSYYNNSFQYNHWAHNFDGVDANHDGICDRPFIEIFDDMNYRYWTLIDYHPLFEDLDGDGLDDLQEIHFNTDMNMPDTDMDSLSDFDEVRVYHTNPNLQDSDGDLLIDWEEVSEANDGYITNPNVADTDGDQFSDYFEYLAGSDPTDITSFPGGYIDDGNTDEIDEEEDDGQLGQQATIPGYDLLVIIGCTGLAVIFVYRRIRKQRINSYESTFKEAKV